MTPPPTLWFSLLLMVAPCNAQSSGDLLDRIAAGSGRAEFEQLLAERRTLEAQLADAAVDEQGGASSSLWRQAGKVLENVRHRGGLPAPMREGLRDLAGLGAELAIGSLSFEVQIGYAVVSDLRERLRDGPVATAETLGSDLASKPRRGGGAMHPRAQRMFAAFHWFSVLGTAGEALDKIRRGWREAADESSEAERVQDRIHARLRSVEARLAILQAPFDPVCREEIDARSADPATRAGLQTLAAPAIDALAPALARHDDSPPADDRARTLEQFLQSAIEADTLAGLGEFARSNEFTATLDRLRNPAAPPPPRHDPTADGDSADQPRATLRWEAMDRLADRDPATRDSTDWAQRLAPLMETANAQTRAYWEQRIAREQDLQRRRDALTPRHPASSAAGSMPGGSNLGIAAQYRRAAAAAREAAAQYRARGQEQEAQRAEEKARQLDADADRLRSR